MTRSTLSRSSLALLFAAGLLLLPACGGGSSGDSTPPATGSIQVLNNTGTDLVDVEVWQNGAKVAEIGGGLVLGGSWTFSNLAPGVYDVHGFQPGAGLTLILFYLDNTVQSGLTTNLTLTP
jgi:hypothetical protein